MGELTAPASRPGWRPSREVQAVCLGLAALLAGCSNSGHPAAGPVKLPSAPASAAPSTTDLEVAPEPREIPSGRLAFVSDSGLGVIYEFDLGRRRFIGPAPSTTQLRFGRLPGDPTVLEPSVTPQKEAVVGGVLYVGGGGSSTLVAIPIGAAGLGQPKSFVVPMVIASFQGNPRPVTQPVISFVAGTPSGKVLAIGRTLHQGLSLAYLFDPATQSFVKGAQLTDGTPQAITSTPRGVVVVTGNRRMVDLLDESLTQHTLADLPAVPTGVTLLGERLYVAVQTAPKHLLAVDLAGGEPQVVAETAATGPSGPVATDGVGSIFWATNPTRGEITRVSVTTKATKTFNACINPSALAWAGDGLLIATCIGHDELALVQGDGTAAATTPAGYFPVDVVVDPE
jgi:hypothetical protein